MREKKSKLKKKKEYHKHWSQLGVWHEDHSLESISKLKSPHQDIIVTNKNDPNSFLNGL